MNIVDDNNDSSPSSWKCKHWSDYCWIIIELCEQAIIDMIEIKNDCSAFIEIFSSTTGDSNDFKVFITNNNNNDDVFVIDISQNHYYERKSKLLIKKKTKN